MTHVFLSYARSDISYVDALDVSMSARGIIVWRDSRVDYGDEWMLEIETRLDTSTAVVVVMTETARQSRWVNGELARAQRKDIAVIPLLLSGEPFLALESSQVVDVRDGQLPPDNFYVQLENALGSAIVQVGGSVSAPGPAPSSSAVEHETDRGPDLASRIHSLLPAMRLAGWNGRSIIVQWRRAGLNEIGTVSIRKASWVPLFEAHSDWVQYSSSKQFPTEDTMSRIGWKRPSILDSAEYAESMEKLAAEREPAEDELTIGRFRYYAGWKVGRRTTNAVAVLVSELKLQPSDVLTVELMRPKLLSSGYLPSIKG